MNRTILSGRPVADAETGTSDSGKAFAKFCFVYDRRSGADRAEREAMFVNCVAFDGLAESIVGPYVRKGEKLTVTGRLEPDNYDSADTKYRSFTFIVDEVVLPDRPRPESDQEVPAS